MFAVISTGRLVLTILGKHSRRAGQRPPWVFLFCNVFDKVKNLSVGPPGTYQVFRDTLNVLVGQVIIIHPFHLPVISSAFQPRGYSAAPGRCQRTYATSDLAAAVRRRRNSPKMEMGSKARRLRLAFTSLISEAHISLKWR